MWEGRRRKRWQTRCAGGPARSRRLAHGAWRAAWRLLDPRRVPLRCTTHRSLFARCDCGCDCLHCWFPPIVGAVPAW